MTSGAEATAGFAGTDIGQLGPGIVWFSMHRHVSSLLFKALYIDQAGCSGRHTSQIHFLG